LVDRSLNPVFPIWFPDALNLGTQLRIPLGAIRPQGRVSQPGGMDAIGRWRDRQNPEDRLDAIHVDRHPPASAHPAAEIRYLNPAGKFQFFNLVLEWR
jgi:hypothetical protein